MKMNKYIHSVVLASSLFASFQVFAQSRDNTTYGNSSGSSLQQPVSLNEIKKKLAVELDRRLITLSRTVHLYHYFQWKAPIGPKRNVGLKHSLFQNYFKSELGQFWMESPPPIVTGKQIGRAHV